MRQRIPFWSLFLLLLALAACGGPSASSATTTPTRAASPTPGPTPSPTPTPPSGFVYYVNSAQTYQIAYPTGWTILNAKTQTQFTGGSQLFEVSVSSVTAGTTPAQIVNAYCQSLQKGVAPDPVATSSVHLAGQSWTRANCDARAQSPAIEVVVEVIFYKGAVYQMDYTSPIVEYSRDDSRYYGPMERSFRFLR